MISLEIKVLLDLSLNYDIMDDPDKQKNYKIVDTFSIESFPLFHNYRGERGDELLVNKNSHEFFE